MPPGLYILLFEQLFRTAQKFWSVSMKTPQLRTKADKVSFDFNPTRHNPGQRQKINLKFLFSHFFVVPQKV